MKAITTRSGVAYEGPSIPTNPSPKKVVKRETEETTDKEQTNFQGSTAHIQPPVNPIPVLELDVPKTLPKPNISYPSRLNDQKFHEKVSNQMEKIFQIFQDLRFDISFADTLILMPRFAPTIKNLLMNEDKLFELAKIPLDVILKLHFPTDFVVVDFEADPRVPLIVGRSFLRTDRALIDLYGEEITLRVNDEAVTFNLDQTTSYSFTYDDMLVNRIDIIDVASEEYAQEVLGFSNNSSGGNPTMTFEPIISDSFLSFTLFEETSEIRNHFSSGSTTLLSDSRPSLVSFETSDSLIEEFADELALLDPFPPGNEDVDFEAEQDVERKDSNVSNINEPVLLNTPLFDKDKCFDPGGKIDKIDAFMDAYNDSEGDVLEILHNT
ncbi:hypothetical protein Tco_0913164 [Tanacetum coccineum]